LHDKKQKRKLKTQKKKRNSKWEEKGGERNSLKKKSTFNLMRDPKTFTSTTPKATKRKNRYIYIYMQLARKVM